MAILDNFLNAIQYLKGMLLLRKHGACKAVLKASVKLSIVIDGIKLEVDVGASETGIIVGGGLLNKMEKAFAETSANAAAILLDVVQKGAGCKVEYTVIGCSGRVRFY